MGNLMDLYLAVNDYTEFYTSLDHIKSYSEEGYDIYKFVPVKVEDIDDEITNPSEIKPIIFSGSVNFKEEKENGERDNH